ncbi:MAG: AsmA-like C-terminal region-containing protein, partial [Woeseiaceae bacterium]
LILPGREEPAVREAADIDPRNLPSIELRAEEFALGERNLGSVSAIFEKTPFGLESGNVAARDDTFTITGSAGWTVGEQDPSTRQSYVVAKLKSSDVAATMQRLNYEPGIEGQDMEIDFDLHWPGGPRQDYMSELDGNVGVRLGSGQLDDVEPGPGRVFGLMSIVALPRRLSLDFRDVLDKGFGFDEITGRFRLEDGVAYTCDLSLKGPAADVGIVGRAGLASRDYHQTAVVSANVGNTLPVVGAVVAGPQVAAALLIFSQIFKKPLQEMGQVYYAIEGSWDEPDVESTNAQHFAESSAMADCVQPAE